LRRSGHQASISSPRRGNFFLARSHCEAALHNCKSNSKTNRSMDHSQQFAVRAAMRCTAVACLSMCLGLVAEPPSIATAAPTQVAPPSKQPNFELVIQILKQHFGSLPDYQPGDLVTQSQIAEVLGKLHDVGCHVPDAERITKLALPDDSFLPKELATPAGRTFMRKISRHPGAYSQVDRLSSIARGQRIVRDLIRQRGGDEFVEYLTTTKGGHKLGDMLAGAQQGVDLNKPTGRIYTASDFALELRREFDRQIQK
jgi:hypothetical protein